jgi:hypothetical protein
MIIKIMKIFVSHAVVDRELASKFVDLLQLGVGILRAQIFFSSYPGSIPNAEYFVQHILKELNGSDLVIALLSHAYFRSQFCLAEAGAALARREQGNADFYSLVIPPEKLSTLGGVLYARQTGFITAAAALDELREVLRTRFTNIAGDPTWGHQQRAFLKDAAQLVNHQAAQEVSARVTLQTLEISRASATDTPPPSYKLKMRIVLRNDTGSDIKIGPATWKSGIDKIRLQSPPVSPLKLQVETDVGWSPEDFSIDVPDGRLFRTWIGIRESTAEKDFLSRHVEKRLGELQLALKISGEDVKLNIKL